MRAGDNKRPNDGKTLAERLAEARVSSRKAMDDEDALPDVEADEVELEQDLEPDVESMLDPEAEELPASETEAIIEAAKAARGPTKTAAARGKTCLVVDDSRVVRKLTSKIVSELGYKVIEAENGEEALARCAKNMPELVVTDWNMPVMTGIDFVMNLRAMPSSTVPIVVFCTSKGEAQDIHAGISAGADDYIVKPFAEEALAAKLQKLGVI